MGIIPIRIETGIFTYLKIEQRLCQLCYTDKVEDEIYFIFHCPMYESTRWIFFNNVANDVEDFWNMSNFDKLRLFNTEYVCQFAKYLVKIFQERRNYEYNNT